MNNLDKTLATSTIIGGLGMLKGLATYNNNILDDNLFLISYGLLLTSSVLAAIYDTGSSKGQAIKSQINNYYLSR